jgi:hypothetical protein
MRPALFMHQSDFRSVNEFTKMIPVKLTQTLAFAALALAMGTSPTPCSAGQNTYGTPVGTMTATTPDPTLVTWPTETKPHHQIRADQTYTAESDVSMPTGQKFDPHGEVGLRRFFQTRDNYPKGPMSELTTNSKDRPANSPFTKSHQIQDYGPYVPDQSTFISNSQPANDVYGVETIEVVYVDGSGNQTVLDYQRIDIYYPVPSEAATFYVQNFQQKIALNTSTGPNPTSYGGDPPRAIMTTTKTIYPGAESWVVIYSGPAQATPPSGAVKIASTDAVAPGGDAWQRNNVYIDLGNYVNGPGIYTLQVVQQSVYGTETFGNPASFSITKSYNVNSQLGLTK